MGHANLKRIIQGAASNRILDLFSVRRRHGSRASWNDAPLFRNKRLNCGFIIKHTVRPHERPYMLTDKPIVTKVILPLTVSDLSRGGHSFCLQERGFEARFRQFLETDCPDDPYSDDMSRLRDLAQLPSFDPFLLSSWSRFQEDPISPLYFDLTESDVETMERHFAREISEVVGRAVGIELGGRDDERSRKFARAILMGDQDERMDLFRQAMNLTSEEFKDGLFGWKGLLYYTWQMEKTVASLKTFAIQINDLVVDGSTLDEREMMNGMRRFILAETARRWGSLRQSIAAYRTALDGFASGESPTLLSDFLLAAPDLFMQLGEDLAAVQHVTSYWTHWRERSEDRIAVREALDLFEGFVKSLQMMRRKGEVEMLAA